VFGILLTLLILDGILLMVVVLLQAGKGGGLAAMGGGGGGAGTDSFMGGRQAATVLTKSTWITGAVFLALALVLSILSSRRTDTAPLLQDEFQSAPAAPQPVLPGGDPGAGTAAPGEAVPGVGEGGAGTAAPEGGEDSGGR
jgi:preprotein translocase subunit SecG